VRFSGFGRAVLLVASTQVVRRGHRGQERGGTMIRKVTVVTAVAGLALLVAAPALGKGQPVTTTDEEATALARSRALEKMEQAFQARGRELNRQHGLGENTGATVYPPDAIERAVTGQRPGTERAIDDHFRYDPADLAKPAPVSSPSGNEVEWPQIGVGFAVGMLLVLGIGLVLRFARIRPLAH
jgi:hypothetical protein